MGLNGNDPGDRKLAISLRLKAARHLAGGRNAKGQAVALPVAELAQHALMRENGITKNRLDEYEQMKVEHPRRMELEQIADALEVPRSFLTEPLAAQRPSSLLSPTTAEQAVEELQHATRVMQEVLARLGRDAGRRDLQSRGAKDQTPKSPPAAA